MPSNPNVEVWLQVPADCDMSYQVTNADDIEFTLDGFSLVVEGASLRRFVTMSEGALTELAQAQAEYAEAARA
ncbi:hypothetical protein V5P93_005880 [Actinokineospora auranticolor]|uniref:Uncharacterized protein n=1 Tax=Actinokineospora auranticolor TaxID=155976 RepID=A0A2S6GHM3_9PSEU|nr:hypothetical protein [Actinokineospora auranticolor]PPK64732.1 hypothetical protein CLV40_118122 [Actinokineospora auranticolor]